MTQPHRLHHISPCPPTPWLTGLLVVPDAEALLILVVATLSGSVFLDVYRGDILSLLSSLPGCHMCTEASHQLPTSLSSPLRLSSTLKQLSHNFFTVCGKQLLFISPSFAMILNSTRAGIVLFCCVLYI